MLEQILSNPLTAIALVVAVVYMAAIYFTHKERAKVRQMKGRRGFSPQWSSGRRHRARRRTSSGGGFKPQWNRDRAGVEESTSAAEVGRSDGGGGHETSGDRPEGSPGSGIR